MVSKTHLIFIILNVKRPRQHGFGIFTSYLQLPECSHKIDGKLGLKGLGFHQDYGVLKDNKLELEFKVITEKRN